MALMSELFSKTHLPQSCPKIFSHHRDCRERTYLVSAPAWAASAETRGVARLRGAENSRGSRRNLYRPLGTRLSGFEGWDRRLDLACPLHRAPLLPQPLKL